MKPVFLILIVLLAAAGCTTPNAHPPKTTLPAPVTPVYTPEKPVSVSAMRFDSTKILITYDGGPDADHLLELETTVITGTGSVYIRSMGSRLDTTPVQIGGTDIFPGPFTGTVHVLTTGYFTNGTHTDILDTWI